MFGVSFRMLNFHLHFLFHKSHTFFAILKLGLFLSFVSILLYFNKSSCFSMTYCKYLSFDFVDGGFVVVFCLAFKIFIYLNLLVFFLMNSKESFKGVVVTLKYKLWWHTVQNIPCHMVAFNVGTPKFKSQLGH